MPVTSISPDPRFFSTNQPLSVAQAAKIASAELCHASAGADISHVAPVDAAGAGAAVFVDGVNALEAAKDTLSAPALVLTTEKTSGSVREAWPDAACVVTPSPKAGFAAIARALHESRMAVEVADVFIASSASIAPSAMIGAGVVVMADAQIGAGSRIGPGCVIGPGVEIGNDCYIGPQCTISHAVLGARCVLSSGVRVGEAGFGYVAGPGGAETVPQLGRVLIADAVHLGANTTVDRGALYDTLIGEGTKIDNLVQIAHNCQIGRHVLIASQTGVSGSCVVGDGVMIGGQAGMADHLSIGAGAVVTAKAGLMKDIPAGEKWGGIPAKPAREWMKEVATIARLSKKGKS